MPDETIAARLAGVVERLHAVYLERVYHTWFYWIDQTPEGTAALADALGILVEELYPAEWAAAWEQFANDGSVLPRGPRGVQGTAG